MADSELGRVTTEDGFDSYVWTVPGSRTKNHRPLALPLPHQAVTALAAWPRIKDRDKLFGRVMRDRPDTGFQGWSLAKARLDNRIARANAVRRLGKPLAKGEEPSEDDELAPWDLHDLRRTVETRLASIKVRKEIANRILNHAAAPITETYDLYDYLPDKADALQRWADKLDTIVAKPSRTNVVPMAARA